MDELNGKFWMVWNPVGRQPTFKHPSESAAKTEAERLARIWPNERFWVLEAVGHMRVVAPCPWTPAEDGLPF
jgi:hypothetical protein